MRWLGRALAALLLAVSAAAAAPAQAQSGERILVYDADLRIEPSGDLLVSEQITYDFGADERHGIIRDLPVRVRYDSHYDRVYRVEVLGVYGGEETPGGYELSAHGSLLRLRIGDPDQTISGRHSYKIDYRVPAPRPVLDERWSLARAFAATPPALGLAGAVLLVALLVALLVLGWLLRATGRGRRAAG